MEWAYPVSGFVVGLIVGVTGVGGGALMTPLLVLGFGITPAIAVGTDLLYATLTKAGGAFAHARAGNVEWRVVGWLACGSLPAAATTLLVLDALRVTPSALSSLINATLAGALVVTAAALAFGGVLSSRRPSRPRPAPDRAAATVAVGGVIGAMVTISSVGAGAAGAAALIALHGHLSTRRIVGSDIAHAVPLTLLAGIGHAAMGHVDFPLLASLLVGSLPGIWLGARISLRLPDHWLRSLLVAMLLLIGGRLVL